MPHSTERRQETVNEDCELKVPCWVTGFQTAEVSTGPPGQWLFLGLRLPQGSQEERQPAWPSAAVCGDRAPLQVTFCRWGEGSRASLTCVH